MKRLRIFAPALLGFLALAAGIFWAVSSYVPPRTVILRDDGFHPRALTIQAGETVTFKDGRDKYFWPASDFHPTHALYPAFDAKQPLPPGSSWSFTFPDPGTYKYHDHLAAFYLGVIRVAAPDGSVPDNCMERGGDFECWQNQVFLALVDHGVDAAYDVVAKLYADEPAFAASCHFIAHNLGLASYQFYQSDHDSILSPKAVACAAGFYHGFMEGFLGATGDVHAAAQLCERIGKKIGDTAPDARLQCYHGIGHGAMETAVATTGSFTSPADMAATAIAMCEQASDGTDERYRCVSGAYNAIANLLINGSYGLTKDNFDPLRMCSTQPDVYKESCYGNMNSAAMWLFKNDFPKAAAYTLTLPDEAYRAMAILYLSGMNALNHIHDADAFPQALTDCRALPAAYRKSCVQGFAHGLLEHGAPGTEYEEASEFCRTSSMTGEERDECYATVLGTLDGWYSKEKTAEICAAADPAYQHYCAP